MYRLSILLLVVGFALAAQAGPITYQGQLQDATGPADTEVDIVFELYEQDEGGSPLASDSHVGVEVIDGLFQVELDLGSGAFDGGERWLQVIVNGQELAPRQRVTAAPMALHAPGAGGSSPWVIDGDDIHYDQGSVFIGTSFLPFTNQLLYVREEETFPLRVHSKGSSTALMYRDGPEGEDDSVIPMIDLWRRAYDSPEPGMGAAIDFKLERSDGANVTNGRIETIWVNPQVGENRADMVFRTTGDGHSSSVERLRLTHDYRVEVAGELAFEDDSPQRTAGPIAKAYINDNGSVVNGVNIESVNWEPGISGYRVALANEDYFLQEFVATVTPRGNATGVSTGGQGGDLLVFFEDEQQRDFQVVIYKLPDGVVTTQSINRVAAYERLHEPDDGIRRVGESSGVTNSMPPTADGDDDHALSGHGESKSALATRLHELESEKAELEKRLAALEALLLEDRQVAESQQ